MSKSDPRPATSHITPFGLRMQPELKDRLEQAASEAGRSLNAEIVARLTESFTGTMDQSILISNVARLNLNLASAELRENTAKSHTHSLALLIQEAANILLSRINPSDEKARTILETMVEQAKPYIGDADALEAELQAQIAKIREANQLLRQAGQQLAARVGVTMTYPPDLVSVDDNGNVMMVELKKTPAPTKLSSDGEDRTPEPPEVPKRIVRPASKKTTEK